MKKINLILIAILMVVTVSAQNKRVERKLVGTWTLEEVELENIDEFAQTAFDMQIDLLDQQIAQLEDRIKNIEDEADKQINTEQLENLKTQKADLTLETIKGGFISELDFLVGNLQFILNKDKSSKSVTGGFEQEGTWQIKNKGKELIITENESDITFSISKLTKKKLELILTEEQAELKMIMYMKFSKK